MTLAPDSGVDELAAKLNQIWTQTASDVLEQEGVAANKSLRDIYRVLLDQARNATAEFRWLGKPKLFYSPLQKKKSTNWLRCLLLLPTLGLLVFLLIWYGTAKNYVGLVITAISTATLMTYLSMSAWDSYKTANQIGDMRAEQQLNPVLTRSTLERIAETVDANAASLAGRLQEEQGEGVGALDGLDLAKKLLKLHGEGAEVPDSALTEVRRYLSSCGIVALDYTPQRKALFILLPSNGIRTLQPALVRKVRTVRNGESVEEEVLLEQGVACVNAGEEM
ncbi:MAG: hypothetical protein Q4P84_01090 [Elusimicrobiales bacterium]|nr:hypothetical protein [Elusimicrobiales bacterium]